MILKDILILVVLYTTFQNKLHYYVMKHSTVYDTVMFNKS